MFGSALDLEHTFDTMSSMRRRAIIRRRRITGTALVLSVALAWAAGPLGHALAARDPVPVASRHVVVRTGDTLWSIAVRVAPAQDPRAVVDAIQQANAVDPGHLVPGQTLVLPLG